MWAKREAVAEGARGWTSSLARKLKDKAGEGETCLDLSDCAAPGMQQAGADAPQYLLILSLLFLQCPNPGRNHQPFPPQKPHNTVRTSPVVFLHSYTALCAQDPPSLPECVHLGDRLATYSSKYPQQYLAHSRYKVCIPLKERHVCGASLPSL